MASSFREYLTSGDSFGGDPDPMNDIVGPYQRGVFGRPISAGLPPGAQAVILALANQRQRNAARDLKGLFGGGGAHVAVSRLGAEPMAGSSAPDPADRPKAVPRG